MKTKSLFTKLFNFTLLLYVCGCLFLSKPLSFKNVEPEYQKNLAVSKPDCVEKCLFCCCVRKCLFKIYGMYFEHRVGKCLSRNFYFLSQQSFGDERRKKYLLHDGESNQPKSCYIITTRIRILKLGLATLEKHFSKKKTIFVFAKKSF